MLVITEAELRRLYLEEGLSETEIAHRHDGTQMQVNRLRKKFGIATIRKTDRLGLPTELTLRQQSILIGSMLGDGGLQRVGTDTARYLEHHSVKQAEYLDWKVAEFGALIAKVVPSNKGTHMGRRLTTRAVPMFYPFWQKFYPTGAGNKTFSALDPEEVDALALAVWFLDDGSKSDSHVRFAVGASESDNDVRLRILRKFDLKATLYGEGTDILIGDKTSLTRFLDLVKPHIPLSMGYKLEFKVPRALGVAPRHLLTKEILEAHIAQGHGSDKIAAAMGVSVGVVRRTMDKLGFERPKAGRPSGSKAQPSWETSKIFLKSLDSSIPNYVETIGATCLKLGLPSVMTVEEVRADFVKLRTGLKARIQDDGLIVGGSNAGSKSCISFFQHRYDSCYRTLPSVRRGWADPEWISKAIRFQQKVGDPLLPKSIFRALQVVLRAPTNFRPAIAASIVSKYCPEGGLVLDPCAGYGGRAIGTLAMGRRYVGVDPHPEAKRSFEGLFSAIGIEANLIQAPFEEADLSGIEADLVFTSPPYFDVERYANDTAQSWVRYTLWEQWLIGFLRPLFQKAFASLRPGGRVCFNVNDIRKGRNVLPLVAESLRLATETGFTHETTLQMVLGRIGKVQKTEPILVLVKPRI